MTIFLLSVYVVGVVLTIVSAGAVYDDVQGPETWQMAVALMWPAVLPFVALWALYQFGRRFHRTKWKAADARWGKG